ncbi:MAG: flavin reductase family protein [Variibacter sp.]
MFIEDPRKHGLRYNPFKALVVPRPIGWISTMDTEGRANLAPYSFFNAVADLPPMVCFSPNNPGLGRERKDTLTNIEKTNCFVVNFCSYELRDQMNVSAAHFPADVDEFAVTGLTAAPSVKVHAPRLKEARAALECEFMFRLRLPSDHPSIENNVVFGKVVGIHIADEIISDGKVDIGLYRPVARLGYMDYAVIDESFSMDRPDDNTDLREKRVLSTLRN